MHQRTSKAVCTLKDGQDRALDAIVVLNDVEKILKLAEDRKDH